MTSGEDQNTSEQNEYEESFKRFKTLFIVGAACFCLGVTVLIFGNRFQLYEVQRLGIIFSSFGIGWIVLAVSYLTYMKWCFISGGRETLEQQTEERNPEGVGPMTSRNLRRPQSSNLNEIPRSAEGRSLGPPLPSGTNTRRSPSPLVQNAQLPTSENGFQIPLYSSKKSVRRSYSVRNFKGLSYSEKNCKRLTSSFKNFERPLSSGKRYEKRLPLVNNTKVKLQLEGNFQRLPSSDEKLDDRLPDVRAYMESHLERLPLTERNYKVLTSSERQLLESPSSESRHFERQSSLVKNTERQRSTENYKQIPPSQMWYCKRPSSRHFERQSSLVKNTGSQRSTENYKQIPPSQMWYCERPSSRHFERQSSLVKNTGSQRSTEINYKEIPPSERWHYERSSSESRHLERRSSLVKNIEIHPSSMQNFDMCSGNNFSDSMLQSPDGFNRPSSADRNSLSAAHLKTIHQDTPPNYYEVVLSMHKKNDS